MNFDSLEFWKSQTQIQTIPTLDFKNVDQNSTLTKPEFIDEAQNNLKIVIVLSVQLMGFSGFVMIGEFSDFYQLRLPA